MNLKHVLIMATAVTSLSACGQPAPSYDDDWVSDKPTRVCRDKRGTRVDDSKCRSGGGAGAFGWYYLGRNSYVPPVGRPFSKDTVGSYKPAPSTSYYTATTKAPANAVTRGGFGSSVSSGSHSSSVGS